MKFLFELCPQSKAKPDEIQDKYSECSLYYPERSEKCNNPGKLMFPLSFTWHLKIYRKSFSRIGILKKLGDCITEASCICHDVLLGLYACKKGSMAAVSGNGSVHHGGLVQNHSLNDLIFKGNN